MLGAGLGIQSCSGKQIKPLYLDIDPSLDVGCPLGWAGEHDVGRGGSLPLRAIPRE